MAHKRLPIFKSHTHARQAFSRIAKYLVCIQMNAFSAGLLT